ncbi:unnamed protein product [Nippostrongylus brasiliensis]|uniref:Uncharacterized protein n=1 Tax=Nippostrongylus brasiliensis TaxID=27835 RepID=A0A0N4YYP0_NIPBR|nr:unnamed protein product [Nippostrongylus brasiliensis]
MGNYILFELINYDLPDSDDEEANDGHETPNEPASEDDDEIVFPSGLFPLRPGGPPLFLILPLCILYEWLQTNPTLSTVNLE